MKTYNRSMMETYASLLENAARKNGIVSSFASGSLNMITISSWLCREREN